MAVIPKGERIVKANSLTEFRNRLREAGVDIQYHDGIRTITSVGVFTLAFEEILRDSKPVTNDELDVLLGSSAPVKPSKKQKHTPVTEIVKDDEDDEPQYTQETERKEGSDKGASFSGGEMWD